MKIHKTQRLKMIHCIVLIYCSFREWKRLKHSIIKVQLPRYRKWLQVSTPPPPTFPTPAGARKFPLGNLLQLVLRDDGVFSLILLFWKISRTIPLRPRDSLPCPAE